MTSPTVRNTARTPRNGSSRLENGIADPPRHPRPRPVDDGDKDDNVVVVSRGSDMATEVTSWGSRGSALRGGPRFWRQRREPDPPPEVAQAARVLRRRTNPKMPQLPRSCSVCSSNLYCWRELFAHMKTHPEKESQCNMREISPPLGSPVEGEARNHDSSSVDGRELASTLLHASPGAEKDLGDRDAAFSMAGSRGKDVAVASQGEGGSSSAARVSPPKQGLGFDFDLNKPPPEEENDDDNGGGGGLDLGLETLPPEAEERGGQE